MSSALLMKIGQDAIVYERFMSLKALSVTKKELLKVAIARMIASEFPIIDYIGYNQDDLEITVSGEVNRFMAFDQDHAALFNAFDLSYTELRDLVKKFVMYRIDIANGKAFGMFIGKDDNAVVSLFGIHRYFDETTLALVKSHGVELTEIIKDLTRVVEAVR